MRYLLNLTTGEISREGNGFEFEYETVRAEEIEINGGFQLVGTKADGTKFTATLTTEEYFNGAEFVIDAEVVAEETTEETAEEVTAEVVAPVTVKEMDAIVITHASLLGADEINIKLAIGKIKNAVAENIELYNSAKNRVKRDKAIKNLEALERRADTKAHQYANRLRKYKPSAKPVETKLNQLWDMVNELHDLEHDIQIVIKDLLRGAVKISDADKYLYELISLNID